MKSLKSRTLAIEQQVWEMRTCSSCFFSACSLLEFGTKKCNSVSCQVHASFQCTKVVGLDHQIYIKPDSSPKELLTRQLATQYTTTVSCLDWSYVPQEQMHSHRKDQSGGSGEIIFIPSGPFIYPFLIEHIFSIKHVSKYSY